MFHLNITPASVCFQPFPVKTMNWKHITIAQLIAHWNNKPSSLEAMTSTSQSAVCTWPVEPLRSQKQVISTNNTEEPLKSQACCQSRSDVVRQHWCYLLWPVWGDCYWVWALFWVPLAVPLGFKGQQGLTVTTHYIHTIHTQPQRGESSLK